MDLAQRGVLHLPGHVIAGSLSAAVPYPVQRRASDGGLVPDARFGMRAACERCRRYHERCSGEAPCARCKRKGVDCIRTASDRRRREPVEPKPNVPTGLPSPPWSESSLEDDTTALLSACARWWTPLAAVDPLFCVEPTCDSATADVFIAAALALDGQRPPTLNAAAQSCLNRAHAAFDRLLAAGVQPTIAQLQGFAVFALLQRLRCCRLQPSYLERLSTEMIRRRKTSWAQRVVIGRLAAYLALLAGDRLPFAIDRPAHLILRLLTALVHPEQHQRDEARPLASLPTDLLATARSAALAAPADAKRAAFFAGLVLHAIACDDHVRRMQAAEAMIMASATGDLVPQATRALLPRDLTQQLRNADLDVGKARVRNALNGLRAFM